MRINVSYDAAPRYWLATKREALVALRPVLRHFNSSQ